MSSHVYLVFVFILSSKVPPVICWACQFRQQIILTMHYMSDILLGSGYAAVEARERSLGVCIYIVMKKTTW